MANLLRTGVLVMFVLAAASRAAMAQDAPDDKASIAKGKQVLTLLTESKFDEVVAQFDEKMSAAMTAEQARAFWIQLEGQAGRFKSYIDEQVTAPQPGYTAVLLGCQFENNGVNAMIVFGRDGKIAGLGFKPRPGP